MIRRLGDDRRGAALVEFALLAPVFFGFVFLIMEGGRMAWTQQALQETAFAAARCLGLKSTGCASATVMPGWVATRVRRSGIAVTEAAVQATASTTCESRSGMARIIIASPFANSVGTILPAARASMSAVACFPAT